MDDGLHPTTFISLGENTRISMKLLDIIENAKTKPS
jgi:hypothetical protein